LCLTTRSLDRTGPAAAANARSTPAKHALNAFAVSFEGRIELINEQE
jgi:hypothetical protein